MVNIITRYNYDAHQHPGVYFDPKKDKSLTNQADLESTDINKIMARYEKTGVLIDPLMGSERTPTYGDFTEVKDYHTMMVAIRNAERAFGLLPAAVRNRFQNDPQALINFLEDPKNDAEAVKLGLKDKSVLLTALDLDNKTKISAEDRAAIDKLTPEEKIKHIEALKKVAESTSSATGASGTDHAST